MNQMLINFPNKTIRKNKYVCVNFKSKNKNLKVSNQTSQKIFVFVFKFRICINRYHILIICSVYLEISLLTVVI